LPPEARQTRPERISGLGEDLPPFLSFTFHVIEPIPLQPVLLFLHRQRRTVPPRAHLCFSLSYSPLSALFYDPTSPTFSVCPTIIFPIPISNSCPSTFCRCQPHTTPPPVFDYTADSSLFRQENKPFLFQSDPNTSFSHQIQSPQSGFDACP